MNHYYYLIGLVILGILAAVIGEAITQIRVANVIQEISDEAAAEFNKEGE